MDQLTTYEVRQLTGQMECYIHSHPKDPLNQNSGVQLQQAQQNVPVLDGATLTAANDYVSIDPAGGSVTLNLPPAAHSKEFHVTMVGSGELHITPSGSDTICGDSSVILHVQWTSLHLKSADNGNWVIV